VNLLKSLFSEQQYVNYWITSTTEKLKYGQSSNHNNSPRILKAQTSEQSISECDFFCLCVSRNKFRSFMKKKVFYEKKDINAKT
jgi:hypothetical protein